MGANFTEVNKVLAAAAALDANASVGTHSTGWLDLTGVGRVMVLVQLAEVTATGTLDVSIWEASDGAGTGAALVAGKEITQVVAADEGALIGIELRADELGFGMSHIQVRAVVGTDTANYSLLVLGHAVAYAPVGVTLFEEVVS